MKAFTRLNGIVAPMDRANIDTDAIIPKQYLKSVKRTGFGPNLFDDWRYLDAGGPEVDNGKRRPAPDFVLNQPRYEHASILLTRRNFGCGSSREHAVWALMDDGFRAVVGPGFADIFFNNCFKNGLLPIVLSESEVDALFAAVHATPGYSLAADLCAQTLTLPDGHTLGFEIDDFRKHCLLNGLDEIGLTLHHADEIRRYEQRRKHEAPWLF
ncbi:MAG: 3-isopropylmalate dehydratase small subunit [Gammaproteobacteria bacterium]